MHRYSDISGILAAPPDYFMQFLERAKTQKQEEELRGAWNTLLPLMSMKLIKYVSFREYVDQCLGRNIDKRPIAEIEADIDAALRRLEG